jgi:hypothetical protein
MVTLLTALFTVRTKSHFLVTFVNFPCVNTYRFGNVSVNLKSVREERSDMSEELLFEDFKRY